LPSTAEVRASPDLFLSARAVRQVLRHGRDPHEVFVVQVRDTLDGPPPAAASPDAAFDERLRALGFLDPDKHPRVAALLRANQDLFPDELPTFLPPHRPDFDHRIELEPDARPQFRKSFRLSRPEYAELVRQLTHMLEKGFIRASASPWGAPVMFVRKPGAFNTDGSPRLRMCVDYRALNAVTRKDRFQIADIRDLIDDMRGATYFSVTDCRLGFNNIRLVESDEEKTTFSTPAGSYCFTVLPLGLCNAPATFGRFLTFAFRDLTGAPGGLPRTAGIRDGDGVFVYCDDLCIKSSGTAEEHLDLVEKVLRRFREHNLYISLEKTRILETSVPWLGHVLTRVGLRPCPRKTVAINEYPVPRTVSALRRFLGLSGYYRKFIQSFARVAAPLYDLTHNPVRGRTLPWGSAAQAAFDNLKLALVTSPVLAFPDWSKPFIVECDTAPVAVGVGAVLLQADDPADPASATRPIAYASHKLDPTQSRYSASDAEMLGVVLALQEWRVYLAGTGRFTVYNDHAPLQHFFTQPRLNGRQARWLDILGDYDVEIKYRPGKSMVVADAISRAGHEGDLATTLLAILRIRTALPAAHTRTVYISRARPRQPTPAPDPTTFLRDVRRAYKDDKFAAGIIADLAAAPPMPHVRRFSIVDGLLYYTAPDEPRRLYIPATKSNVLRTICLDEHHCTPAAGHGGRRRTYYKVAQRYFWRGLSQSVRSYVASCPDCQRYKHARTAPGYLHPHEPIFDRWEKVGLDFFDMPLSTRGHDAGLLLTDYATKRVHLISCTKSTTAADTAELIMHDLVRLHGMPRVLVSDRDPRFMSHVWQELWASLGTRLNIASPGHAQTDGQAENAIKDVKQQLRVQLLESGADWDRPSRLAMVEFARNDAVHAATGLTPFMLDTGRNPLLPADLLLPPEGRCPAATELRAQLRHDLIEARDAIMCANIITAAAINRRRRPQNYQPGDQVLLSTADIALEGPTKLKPLFLGPFTVSRANDSTYPSAYFLDLAETGLQTLKQPFNADRLRPFALNPREFATRGKGSKPPPLVLYDDGSSLHRVDAIVGERRRATGVEFRVRWSGYEATDDTWEPAKNLDTVPFLIKKFRSSRPRP
jgi:hypothetical protein